MDITVKKAVSVQLFLFNINLNVAVPFCPNIEAIFATIPTFPEYDAAIQEASKAYMDQQFIRAATRYHDAFAICKELQSTERMAAGLLRYAMARCLFESSKLEDLADAVIWLETMDNELKFKLPAVYCLLAQLHCKLYRFDQASEALNKGESVIKAHFGVSKGVYYIPGTKIAISENDVNQVWAKVKAECSTWHKPDAVCNSEECNNVTRPYSTPNRNIFKGDPAFSGMVIVSCNNKERPCCLKFHHSCWKCKKDELYPIQKVSDRDILGSMCFTPSCMHEDDSPCQIASIEVIDSEGELKAHVKDSTLMNRPLSKNVSKGAIKKVRLPLPTQKKDDEPVINARPCEPARIPRDPRTDQADLWGGFNRDQILAVVDDNPLLGIDFSNEPYEIAREKTVILAYFHGYIRNNTVKVSDLDSKYKVFSNGLSNLKDLDVLAFLLQTGKFKVLNNPSSNTLYQSQVNRHHNVNQRFSHFSSTQDIDDVYSELMNDFEVNDPPIQPISRNETPLRNWNNNIQPSTDAYNASHSSFNTGAARAFQKYDSGSGDAPHPKPASTVQSSQMMNHEPQRFDVENLAPPRNEQPERRGTENRKLKEYVAQVENQLEETNKKVTDLEKEIGKKNDIINSHDDEKQVLFRKIEKLENYNKSMEEIRRMNENLRRENMAMKGEVAELTDEKTRLKEEVATLNDPKKKRDHVMKTFQEEYKILQDAINAEWKKETDILKGNLQAEIETKMLLLNKSLEIQYTSNKHFLDRNIEQCTSAIEVLNAINVWMANNVDSKPVVDTSKWLRRLESLRKIVDQHQSEYTKLSDEINSDSACKEMMLDISLPLPEIEGPPEEKLSAAVTKALDDFYKNQCHMIQNLMKMTQQNQSVPGQQSAPPSYPMQVPYNVNNAGGYPMQYQQPRHPLMGQPIMNCPPQRPPLLMQNPMMPQQQYPTIPPFQGHTPQQTTTNGLAPNSPRSSVIRRSSTSSTDSSTQEQPKSGIVMRKESVKSSLVASTGNGNHQINGLPAKVTQISKAFETMSVQPKLPNIVAEEKSSTKNSSSHIISKPVIKPKQKVGIDVLLLLMKKKYPGVLEVDLVETMNDVRKNHNDSLSGIPVRQLLQEAEQFLLRYQELHLLSYFPEEDLRPNFTDAHPETPVAPPQVNVRAPSQVNVRVNTGPPVSKVTPAPPRKVIASESINKKTWNVVPQDEVKWNAGDVTECSICICSLDESTCYTLQCKHSFHYECVKQWLVSDRSCPICRVLITEDEEFPPLRA
ncbi:hypothetical protein QAD02_011430 [Eretmocerus hayati]|uniref:Uncharacterized protein n=1 Tax=Eretmocerus hayati TaxID=131215 RepID=A0ACC2NX75_9HYME|nr:hypothetical protein QAD02_011430 [Eretmocerus hayati]